MMNKVLRVIVILPAILFVMMGLRWITDPVGAGEALGLTLLDGVGRSSQIGDMAAYFLTLGILILIALITAKRSWFYPPILLLSLTAIFRVLAWLLHDAAPATHLIAPEVIIAGLLFFASTRLCEKE